MSEPTGAVRALLQILVQPPQPCRQQLSAAFEDRVGGGGHDVLVDAHEVAKGVEVQCARFGRVRPPRAQAEMR